MTDQELDLLDEQVARLRGWKTFAEEGELMWYRSAYETHRHEWPPSFTRDPMFYGPMLEEELIAVERYPTGAGVWARIRGDIGDSGPTLAIAVCLAIIQRGERDESQIEPCGHFAGVDIRHRHRRAGQS